MLCITPFLALRCFLPTASLYTRCNPQKSSREKEGIWYSWLPENTLFYKQQNHRNKSVGNDASGFPSVTPPFTTASSHHPQFPPPSLTFPPLTRLDFCHVSLPPVTPFISFPSHVLLWLRKRQPALWQIQSCKPTSWWTSPNALVGMRNKFRGNSVSP